MENTLHNEDTRETRKRDASDERAAQMKVVAFHQQGRFDQAEKTLSEALARWPDSASLLVERGALFGSLGQYDKALDAFDKALAHDPGNERAMVLKLMSLRLRRISSRPVWC